MFRKVLPGVIPLFVLVAASLTFSSEQAPAIPVEQLLMVAASDGTTQVAAASPGNKEMTAEGDADEETAADADSDDDMTVDAESDNAAETEQVSANSPK